MQLGFDKENSNSQIILPACGAIYPILLPAYGAIYPILLPVNSVYYQKMYIFALSKKCKIFQ